MMMNFGYPSYPNQPTQSMNPQFGGYPPGYPPLMQQNPFASPYPNPTPPPFVGGEIELQKKDGTVDVIPANPQMNQGFIPGGATISQGGFNPMTGMTAPSVGSSGFSPNPYQNPQLIGNLGYNPMGPTPINTAQGYKPYEPPNFPRPNFGFQGMQNPQPQMYYGYGQQAPMPYYGQTFNPIYGYSYGQNQFNMMMQEYLYQEAPSIIDARVLLEQAILTDEERAKISRNNSIIGRDYYGNPIYTNAYQASQDRQKQFEDARKAYQTHFTMLSRIAHTYAGDEFDEEATMKRFDPVPPAQNQQKVFNWYTATEEEKAQYQKDMRIAATNDAMYRINQAQAMEEQMKAQKQAMFNQIKASHDKLIGVEPGQAYNLKTFMDNGYKIGVNIAMEDAKKIMRNGQLKYSTNAYREGMAQASNSSIPITSKDDEYVSIEQMLKGIYDRNKQDFATLRAQQVGPNQFTSPGAAYQVPEFETERQSHEYFLNAIQAKKVKNDIQRSVI